jgi:hypothetical protein
MGRAQDVLAISSVSLRERVFESIYVQHKGGLCATNVLASKSRGLPPLEPVMMSSVGVACKNTY